MVYHTAQFKGVRMNIVEKVNKLAQELANGKDRSGKMLQIEYNEIKDYEKDEEKYNKTGFDFSKLPAADIEKIAKKIKGQIDKSILAGDLSFVEFLDFSKLTKTEKKAFRKPQLEVMKAEYKEKTTSVKTKLLEIAEAEDV